MVVGAVEDIIPMAAMDRLPLPRYHQAAAEVVEAAKAITQVVPIVADAPGQHVTIMAKTAMETITEDMRHIVGMSLTSG